MHDVLTFDREETAVSATGEVPEGEQREEILRLARGPRLLADFGSAADGPTLICVGSLHGNEPAGALALARLAERLAPMGERFRGRFVAFLGNRGAIEAGRRFLDHDLNRIWSAENIERLRQIGEANLETEERELLELTREIERVLDEAGDGPIFFLDLHTTSGDGHAFANLDDTLPNREFALHFPVTLVVGIEEELAGTLTGYLVDDYSVITVGFESGQHDEPEAVERAEAAIWIALAATELLPEGDLIETRAREVLEDHRGDLPHVVEVLYRHAIVQDDGFEMKPGYHNFQPVKAGEIVAHDRHGEVLAPLTGRILMPLYQEQGEDGFFIVRPLHPAWLRLSSFLRRLNSERFLRFLPGVKPNPERADSYIVDRRYARFLALEIFHLLGYRRHGEKSRFLVMTRRAHDR